MCRSKAADLDPKTLSVWYTTVANMRTELAAWTARQSKHAAVGYPIITILLSLEDTPSFMQFIDTLVENLHRQLKARCSQPNPIYTDMFMQPHRGSSVIHGIAS